MHQSSAEHRDGKGPTTLVFHLSTSRAGAPEARTVADVSQRSASLGCAMSIKIRATSDVKRYQNECHHHSAIDVKNGATWRSRTVSIVRKCRRRVDVV